MGRKPEDKKSFQLYNDYMDTVNLMPDEEAGRLFKAILAHANGIDEGELSGVSLIAFSLIKSQMDRDAEKYRAKCEANRMNGALGGRPRLMGEKPDGFSENRSVFGGAPEEGENEQNNAKNDDIPPEKPSKTEYSADFEAFWRVYPRHDDKGQAYKKFQARLKNGFSAEELCQAASRYRAKCQREGTEQKYIKQAKTFLGDATPFTDYLDMKAPRATVDDRMRSGSNPFRGA